MYSTLDTHWATWVQGRHSLEVSNPPSTPSPALGKNCSVLRKALAAVGLPPVFSFCFSGEELPHQLAPKSFATCWTQSFLKVQNGSGDMGILHWLSNSFWR